MTTFRRLFAAALALVAAAAAAHAADLSPAAAWVGKYPFDRIGRHTFFTHPAIRAAREQATGPQVFRRIQRIQGPAVPIVRIGDYVAAWHCQQHDCGDRNTTTILRLGKGDAVVCVHDGPGAVTRWYIPGRGAVAQADARGGCPSEEPAIRSAIGRLGL
ncbi:MAG: hypothetical protein KIT16_23050 [Rhodospirillaceae bacterium]|nr:hypothetical protein [Rhodospirillaceae bacterium]